MIRLDWNVAKVLSLELQLLPLLYRVGDIDLLIFEAQTCVN